MVGAFNERDESGTEIPLFSISSGLKFPTGELYSHNLFP